MVASRIGQIEEAIRDGVDGVLCPPGDAPALAAALVRLADDPGLRSRLGRAARQIVVAERTWSAVAERIIGLVHEAGVARGAVRAKRSVDALPR